MFLASDSVTGMIAWRIEAEAGFVIWHIVECPP